MTTKRTFRSDVLAVIHSTADAMHRIGTIDEATMREFDAMCLAAPAGRATPRGSQPRRRSKD